MGNVVVVGSQWGDEGKGKIVDWLSERADMVVRFQGGHNAGHTLVIDGISYKLSPACHRALCAPANWRSSAMVWSSIPHALIAEIGPPRRLRGSMLRRTLCELPIMPRSSCHCIANSMPFARTPHPVRVRKSERPGAGIGPAYEDKVGRRAIRIMDLAEPATLPAKIDRLLTHHNALRRGLDQPDSSVPLPF